MAPTAFAHLETLLMIGVDQLSASPNGRRGVVSYYALCCSAWKSRRAAAMCLESFCEQRGRDPPFPGNSPRTPGTHRSPSRHRGDQKGAAGQCAVP